MKPYFESKHCTLYHGDCLEIMPELPKVDLVLTDPPYGIGENSNQQSTRGGYTRFKGGNSKCVEPKDYGVYNWDKVPVSDELIQAVRDKATYQIIFGGNYYDLPPTTCWLIWDKQNTGDFADCEMAWTNFPKAIRIIHHMWNGMLRKGNEERFHPTQKPLDVITWVLKQAPSNTETVLDPFMGSGTTGVACCKTNRQFIGIEMEEKYVEIAAKRIERAEIDAAQNLFLEPEPAALPKQEVMAL